MPPAKDKPKSENISTPKGKNLLKNEGSGMFGDKQDDLFYEKPKVRICLCHKMVKPAAKCSSYHVALQVCSSWLLMNQFTLHSYMLCNC